jgi:hypothetical protein
MSNSVLLPKTRHFSIQGLDVDKFGDIESLDGNTYTIPYRMGTIYWAILSVMYYNINQRVYYEELIEQVHETMIDQDPKYWDKFINKKSVKVWKNGKTIEKTPETWQNRIITNARTLTRFDKNSPYGLRVRELGHSLNLYYDDQNKPYFILLKI